MRRHSPRTVGTGRAACSSWKTQMCSVERRRRRDARPGDHRGHYLAAGGGERGEDGGVDEAQLRLDLVAAEIVDGRAALVQDQVLGGGPKPTAMTACSRRPLRQTPTTGVAATPGAKVEGRGRRVSAGSESLAAPPLCLQVQGPDSHPPGRCCQEPQTNPEAERSGASSQALGTVE